MDPPISTKLSHSEVEYYGGLVGLYGLHHPELNFYNMVEGALRYYSNDGVLGQ